MLAAIYDHLEHVLCVLLLIARIGDVTTTYLTSPTLELEANPIARKLGWRFAILSLAACLLPYVNTAVAVTALIAFLLVSASNAGKIWMVRTIGEKAFMALLMDLARRSKPSHALLGIAASSFFVALTGATILLFYPDPSEDWGFWIGLGIVLYAFLLWLYGTLFTIRLFRRAIPEAAGAT